MNGSSVGARGTVRLLRVLGTEKQGDEMAASGRTRSSQLPRAATERSTFGPIDSRVRLARRQEGRTRGSPNDDRTSLPNVVTAETSRPDNVNTARPLEWYRPVWGSRT